MNNAVAVFFLVSPVLFIVTLIVYLRLRKKYAPFKKAKLTAEQIIRDAEDQRQQSLKEMEAVKAEAVETRKRAAVEADATIANAKAEAEQIAGDALAAQGKAKEFEKAVKALQNIINGYGDEYLMPSQNLLDDLAEEYSFLDAGKDLKAARDKSRGMVKAGLAAQCDYVEENRRKTAIAFVVDAFNGKVDSILSRAKKDNFGKLSQEIRDARTVVDMNGAAFRNARVTEEYMNARIEELRLGCVAFELKERDKEEQRAIKERIREEEKARRDQERALREVAKQEDMLRKAMDAAREQMAAASAEERKRFEGQLAELEGKLAEAEAKAQRAKSMAEMTKSGHVYVISNIGSFGEDVLKIGMTRRLEPLDRVRELGDASVPFPFDVHAMIYTEDAPKLENELHRRFNETRLNKVNFRKEFFRTEISSIRDALAELGVEATFTIRADALEYRESLAINNLSDEQRHEILERLEEAAEKDDPGEQEIEEAS